MHISCDCNNGCCPKLKKGCERLVYSCFIIIYGPGVSTVNRPFFISNFWHSSVHFNFIQLRLYTNERILNRMQFTASRNSKYFRFYGTYNFGRNRLRMPSSFFFLQPIVPLIFDNFLIELARISLIGGRFLTIFLRRIFHESLIFFFSARIVTALLPYMIMHTKNSQCDFLDIKICSDFDIFRRIGIYNMDTGFSQPFWTPGYFLENDL